jgi:cysteine-rich repeat protein
MQIAGEYFGASTPSVYFWQAGASSSLISSRTQVETNKIKSFSSSILGDDLLFYGGPPTNSISGPVVIYRTVDTKMSNPLNFTVWDCVKNNNTCSQQDTLGQYKCCATGKDQGFCKSAGDLCDGETRSAGYIWRFSTKEIPKKPHVVERCDNGTNATPPQNIPSPSPSIQWDNSIYGDHHNVCRTASVVVEFDSDKIQDISSQYIIVNKCSSSSINLASRDCTSLGKVSMEDYQSNTLNFKVGDSANNVKYIELNIANGGKWEDNTWYQVALTDGIKAVSGTISTSLAADKPCKAGSAYCFLFKTDARDCKMKAVYVTPYKYLTTFLESPIKDLWYHGHGMSDQNCIMMNVSGFQWDWSSSNTLYADIYYGAGATNTTTVQVSSKSNTVNIGFKNPDNAVNINAVASTGSLKYTGQSPLTIDLTHPAIVDYWPKCTEACTNAEVGVRFNTTMSNFNLNTKSVRLLECQDENCLSVKPVDNAKDIIFDSNSDPKNIIIKIANSLPDSIELTPNRKYKVSISASTTNMNSNQLLWTATSSNDLNSQGFPYNEEFNWSFATKKARCEISKVDVTPSVFNTKLRTDRAVYQAETYSSPDACNANGQKINPWSVDWTWSTSDKTIADLFTANTKGFSEYCTNRCVKRGSYLSFGSTSVLPVCGNNITEAGEDCDPPNNTTKRCGLDCLLLGNEYATTTKGLHGCGDGIVENDYGEECDPGNTSTTIGCSNKCLNLGSSVTPKSSTPNVSDCGSGLIGSGEDCDIGIMSSSSDPYSAMGCSNNCLHFGTNLTGEWCFKNKIV